MPELGSHGSVRGARGNSRPYREIRRGPIKSTRPVADMLALHRGSGLLQLVGAGLMIAVLKRSRFDYRERPQRVDCTACLHALVFSGACNIFTGETSISSERKICQTFVAVHIYRLAHGGPCELSVKRSVHAHAAEGVLVKHALGRIAAGSTRHLITRCGVGLGERDHVVNAGPASRVVVAAFLW